MPVPTNAEVDAAVPSSGTPVRSLTNALLKAVLTNLNELFAQSGEVTPYVHTQSVSAATWVVNHNLGRNPASVVVIVANQIVEAETAVMTVNQIEVRFSSARTGTVYVF